MFDALPFEDVWSKSGTVNVQKKAVVSFVRFLERRLHARIVYEGATIPFQKPALLDLFVVAETLKTTGVIQTLRLEEPLPDEPPLHTWSVACVHDYTIRENLVASGISSENERAALTVALAEAVERHVLASRTDYFVAEKKETVSNMHYKGIAALALERIVSLPQAFSEAQKFLWIRGDSLISKRALWVPAQIVSGNPGVLVALNEPLLREQNTTGCAVGETKETALLQGALEVIERDAYMILWLNRLTLPQVNLDQLTLRSTSLSRLMKLCTRYRLRPSVIRMITDAPTYALAVVLKDESGMIPKISLGLKAHRNPALAAEGALLEALRIRPDVRRAQDETYDKSPERISDIGHFDRLRYWAEDNRAKALTFLTDGPTNDLQSEPWELDTDKEHLARIVAWCREKGYECASVSLTKSKGNPTPWHLEHVIIPELQPLYLKEKNRPIDSPRLS